jgi:carboxypeptidase Q
MRPSGQRLARAPAYIPERNTRVREVNQRLLPAISRSVALIMAAALVAQPLIAAPASNNNEPDLQMVTRIRQEGFRNSKVMETESELTDRLGQRLTGSPNLKRANEWTRDQFTQWGLVNAHLEGFPFGRGWSLESVSVRMIAPDVAPLYALPKAWTPSTNGPVRGQVVRLTATTPEDLAKLKGTLAGKIVLTGEMRQITPQTEAALKRYDEKGLADLSAYSIPGERLQDPTGRVFSREDLIKRFQFQRTLTKFLAEEKVAATIEPSRGDAGLIFVQGTQAFREGEGDGYPQFVMAVEHWGRINRLLERKVPVEVEVDLKAKFEDADKNAYNTIAEIPGTDKKDEIVMVGAHLDSWHGGTGATDNAAGSAITMEAMRILQALGVKPRRTIRIGLWGGEEEGLLGSRAYVAEHFGKRDTPERNDGIPGFLRQEQAPGKLTIKAEQAKVAAYFNIDNGTGKLRGIYLQENSAVRPVIEPWMEPFRDLGFTTISMRNTGGTDHLSFDAVGIPGFQFIQDEVEYNARTHHSNMDVYERIQREDMMQASVILASFLYNAAMRDEMLPRKPLPKEAVMETPAPEPGKTKAPAKKASKETKPAKEAPKG